MPFAANRRRFLGSVAFGAGAVYVAACGRGGRAGQQAGQSASQKQAKRGGQLNINISSDPFDWDLSYQGKSVPNGKGMILAYNKLLRNKTGPGVAYTDLTLEPELAQSWEVPDAAHYVFHLRPGVKFTNLPPVPGRPLVADDVKWSFEYWSRTGEFKDKKLPKAQFDSFFEGIKSIETPDPQTVVIQFQQPFAPFIHYTASDFIPIVPHEIYDRDGNLKNTIVGTGPFMLDVNASQKGSQWIWKRNPDYWETGKPYLDSIRWLVVPDDASAAAAFRSGQVDVLGVGSTEGISYSLALQVKQQNPHAVSYEFNFPEPYFVWINAQKHPLDDVRVRQALALSIDRDAMLEAISGGKGEWGLTGAWPGAFSSDEIHKLDKHDPAQARRLITEAGYPNGLDIDWNFPGTTYGNDFVTLLQLMQAQVKSAGININLKSVDNAVDSASRKNGTFLISMTPGVSLEGDVDSYLFQKFSPSSKNAYGRLDDPKLNALITAQRQESDPNKRAGIVHQAVLYINEIADDLALVNPIHYYHWQPSVQGLYPNWGSFGQKLTDVWLASTR